MPYFPAVPSLSALPELPRGSEPRLKAAIAKAEKKILRNLDKQWHQILPPGRPTPSGDYTQLIPLFVRYAEKLFEAWAKEFRAVIESPEEYRKFLMTDLVWRVAFRIAPEQNYKARGTEFVVDDPKHGDWTALVLRSWRTFDHPQHARFHSRVVQLFVDSVLQYDVQDNVSERIYKALLRRVPKLYSDSCKSASQAYPTIIDLPDVPFMGPPEIPQLPPESHGRLWADVAAAQVEAVDEIEDVLRVSIERSIQQGLLCSAGEEKLLPIFISYAKRIYPAYSREIGKVEDNPETCRRLLREMLPWAIALKIAPDQTYRVYDHEEVMERRTSPPVVGDWYKLLVQARQRIELAQFTMDQGSLLRDIDWSFLFPVLDPPQQIKIRGKIQQELLKLTEREFAETMKRRSRDREAKAEVQITNNNSTPLPPGSTPSAGSQTNSDPEVAKRLAIVKRNLALKSSELCKRFDLEDLKLIEGWSEKFGVDSWSDAYKKDAWLRRRISTIVSKDKGKVR